MSTRPFQVLGLQQIAIGHANKESLKTLWVDLLGLPITGHFESERENVLEDSLQLGTGPSCVEVDLMQPLNPLAKPAVDQTPLNHIGLWVDDLPKAMSWLMAQGVRMAPGGIRRGASGFDICFIHPKSSDEYPLSGLGVLIELVQAPQAVIEALGSDLSIDRALL